MAAPKPVQIEFSFQDWSAVVERSNAMARAGHGWINLFPEVHDDEQMARPGASHIGLGAMFRVHGPTVPVATWVLRSGKEPGTLGLEHDLRMKVMPRLMEHGIEPPPGSSRLQDNPRRGLVLRLADDISTEDVLAWLMEAVDDLCPLQLTGNWLAEFHEPK